MAALSSNVSPSKEESPGDASGGASVAVAGGADPNLPINAEARRRATVSIGPLQINVFLGDICHIERLPA